jgi:sugar phosphate isomerase/epimerase
VYIACSTLCFARYPLERALRCIAELEFRKVDIAISEQGPHLKPSEVVADVWRAAQRVRSGPGLSPGAFTVDLEASEPAEYQRQLRAICRLARLTLVPLITIPAGPRTPQEQDLEKEVHRLHTLVRLAEEEGIVLSLATRMGTWTEDPDLAVKLCRRVPGLALTLDPSHYLAGPHQGQPFDQVYPYVRHVHLRDSGRSPEHFQVRVGQGEVEYGKIIAHLQRHGYDRLLTVAIHDIPDAPYDMEVEVRKLKYLLESLI